MKFHPPKMSPPYVLKIWVPLKRDFLKTFSGDVCDFSVIYSSVDIYIDILTFMVTLCELCDWVIPQDGGIALTYKPTNRSLLPFRSQS